MTWQIVDTPTVAPTVGGVLRRQDPRLRDGELHRTASLVADSLFVGGYHVAAASQVGSSHLMEGSSRQDAYDFTMNSEGELAVAIADGMGSKPHLQVGARLFCEFVVEAVSTHPGGSASTYLFDAADRAKEVAEIAYHLGAEDIAFVGGVAVFNAHGFEVTRVGDISAFVWDQRGEIVELFPPPEGHVNVVVQSLPPSQMCEPESIGSSNYSRLLLTTDGLANDIRNSEVVRQWLTSCWIDLPSGYTMNEALRYRRRGSHDDRTALIVSIPRPSI